MADEVSIRRPAGAPDMQIAYAWHIQTKDGSSEIIWHNGGTGGYRTYMGYDPKARVGVVVLSNIATAEGPDDIGRHLLNASYPLLQSHASHLERQEITLDPRIFDRYVGVYRLGPSTLLTMSRDGSRFYAQLTGQPKFEVFAESEGKFFLKVVDAQLTFDVDQLGAASKVTLHQNGRDTIATRLSEGEFKRITDEIDARIAEVAKRFKDQTAMPGSADAVRKALEDLRVGYAELRRSYEPWLGRRHSSATRRDLSRCLCHLGFCSLYRSKESHRTALIFMTSNSRMAPWNTGS